MKKYYEAYDERYKIVHQRNTSWEYLKGTPIIIEIIKKCNISKSADILEIGCGEGRDSKVILDSGYNLLATDISEEAISFCKNNYQKYKNSFLKLDCLNNELDKSYDFIYSVAVIHMLVEDDDRNKFYSFIYNHLNDNGLALILTMGDGISEFKTDINEAFELRERDHHSGKISVPATSCRMVSFDNFEDELINNNLDIVEKGITECLPSFNKLMYAVVRKCFLTK